MKVCYKCKISKPKDDFPKNRASKDGLYSYCIICTAEVKKYWKTIYRLEILVLLGGVCTRCGFSDRRALEVDHVYGGGKLGRLGGQIDGSPQTIRIVKSHPDQFQLLCANCHKIKTYENGDYRC